MEFCEKLQELRKSRGLTQEELAEVLYVSRTAISKWESGRGYPSIDSLKEISGYFSVSIDDLLSAEKIVSIAEKENKLNIQNICELLFGVTDLLSIALIVLPLYPKTIEGYIYSVNLWAYSETAFYNLVIYWILFLMLMVVGVLKIAQTQRKAKKGQKMITSCSILLSMTAILYLVLAREAYAATVAILLMSVKGLLVYKYAKCMLQ